MQKEHLTNPTAIHDQNIQKTKNRREANSTKLRATMKTLQPTLHLIIKDLMLFS